MQYSALRVAPIFCGMLATALRMPAAPSVIDLNSLLTNNPFVGTQAVGAKINAQPIELRGIMAERGVYWFNLYDPATKKSVWVCKGETIDEYQIREFDIEKETLQLNSPKESLVLAFEEKQGRLPVANRDGAFAQSGKGAQATPQAVVLSRPEQARLDKVGEAVRARRAQRNQPVVSSRS